MIRAPAQPRRSVEEATTRPDLRTRERGGWATTVEATLAGGYSSSVETTVPRTAASRSAEGRRSRDRPAFELIESKLHPPWLRPGIVARTALVERLLAAPAGAVVCVVAPPGYGKTTLLAQWAQRKGHRVGWITVDSHDNDPAVLLTYLAVALDRIAPIDLEVFKVLASPATPARTPTRGSIFNRRKDDM